MTAARQHLRWLSCVATAGMALVACGNAEPVDPGAGGPGSPSATESSTGSPPPGLEPADLEAYRDWVAAGVDDYRYLLNVSCYCPEYPQVEVTVRDGEVVELTPKVAEPWRDAAVAVPDLFAFVADSRERWDKVDVTYDSELGYPTQIAQDRIAGAIDDELTFIYSGFEQLS